MLNFSVKPGKRRGRPKKSAAKDVDLPDPVENRRPPLPEMGKIPVW